MALLTLGLAACSDDMTDNQSVETTTAAQTDGSEMAEETKATLEVEKEDNGGRTFTMLVAAENEYEFNVAEFNGEIINDTAYQRNLDTEDYLGIKLNFISEKGEWASRKTFNAKITEAVYSNDPLYDLVSGFAVCVMPLSAEGIFVNMLSLENLHLENEWWVSDLEEELAISDKLFTVMGDANLSIYKGFNALFFNKAIINEYSMDDPYRLVRDGKWTFDRFTEMSKQVAVDLNGDGVIAEEVDKVGLCAAAVAQRSWQTAFNVNTFGKNSDGEFELLPLSERFASAYDKMMAFKAEPSTFVNRGVANQDDYLEYTRTFSEDRALFMLNYLYAAESTYMRDMETDYGIVVYPKFDESQENYRSQVATASSIFYLPISASDYELTAKVMETMSYLSCDTVVPAFYETTMKEKYSRDQDVAEMLDIIRDTAVMSFDFLYSTYFTSGNGVTWPNLVLDNEAAPIASAYEAAYKIRTSELESLMEAYEAIE